MANPLSRDGRPFKIDDNPGMTTDVDNCCKCHLGCECICADYVITHANIVLPILPICGDLDCNGAVICCRDLYRQYNAQIAGNTYRLGASHLCGQCQLRGWIPFTWTPGAIEDGGCGECHDPCAGLACPAQAYVDVLISISHIVTPGPERCQILVEWSIVPGIANFDTSPPFCACSSPFMGELAGITDGVRLCSATADCTGTITCNSSPALSWPPSDGCPTTIGPLSLCTDFAPRPCNFCVDPIQLTIFTKDCSGD